MVPRKILKTHNFSLIVPQHFFFNSMVIALMIPQKNLNNQWLQSRKVLLKKSMIIRFLRKILWNTYDFSLDIPSEKILKKTKLIASMVSQKNSWKIHDYSLVSPLEKFYKKIYDYCHDVPTEYSLKKYDYSLVGPSEKILKKSMIIALLVPKKSWLRPRWKIL